MQQQQQQVNSEQSIRKAAGWGWRGGRYECHSYKHISNNVVCEYFVICFHYVLRLKEARQPRVRMCQGVRVVLDPLINSVAKGVLNPLINSVTKGVWPNKHTHKHFKQ